jgi:hypothetical protein
LPSGLGGPGDDPVTHEGISRIVVFGGGPDLLAKFGLPSG